MRVIRIAMIVVATSIVMMIGGVGAFLIYFNVPNDRTIAKSLKVSNDWIEVPIEPPLNAQHRDQSVNLRIQDIDFHAGVTNGVKLKDGTVLNPDIDLIDENGTILTLRPSGSVSKYYVDAVFKPVSETDGFASGRKFTKIRIRSDIPFECQSVYWRDYDPK